MNNNIFHETAANRIITLLLLQQQKSKITTIEEQELNAWIGATAANRQFAERCLDQSQVAASLELMDTIDEEAAWQRFMEKNELNDAPVIPLRKRTWRWIAAAITLGVVATSALLFLPRGSPKTKEEVVAISKGEHILPGTNKATLTLGDGRTITLDDQRNGVLAQEGGTAVNKKGGVLEYDPVGKTHNGGDKPAPVVYNTAKTPRGATIALTLPDKTKVWLNADASIRFPTSFPGKERRVELTGEAYFEVAKNPAKPFIVSTGEAEIKVLGTHFNIRNYADEGTIKTTLLEGSVKVESKNVPANEQEQSTTLKPSQQATIAISSQSTKSPKIIVQTVEVESVVAWKNGYFDFKATPFPDIMKEIRRWYSGIESVDIKTPIEDRFTATISRNVTLATMLTILEETGKAHFEVKGKTLIVTK